MHSIDKWVDLLVRFDLNWPQNNPNCKDRAATNKEKDETECRLFEITKNISNYGVGSLVFNNYETSYDSENFNLLNDSKDPETFWVRSSFALLGL